MRSPILVLYSFSSSSKETAASDLGDPPTTTHNPAPHGSGSVSVNGSHHSFDKVEEDEKEEEDAGSIRESHGLGSDSCEEKVGEDATDSSLEADIFMDSLDKTLRVLEVDEKENEAAKYDGENPSVEEFHGKEKKWNINEDGEDELEVSDSGSDVGISSPAPTVPMNPPSSTSANPATDVSPSRFSSSDSMQHAALPAKSASSDVSRSATDHVAVASPMPAAVIPIGPCSTLGLDAPHFNPKTPLACMAVDNHRGKRNNITHNPQNMAAIPINSHGKESNFEGKDRGSVCFIHSMGIKYSFNAINGGLDLHVGKDDNLNNEGAFNSAFPFPKATTNNDDIGYNNEKATNFSAHYSVAL